MVIRLWLNLKMSKPVRWWVVIMEWRQRCGMPNLKCKSKPRGVNFDASFTHYCKILNCWAMSFLKCTENISLMVLRYIYCSRHTVCRMTEKITVFFKNHILFASIIRQLMEKWIIRYEKFRIWITKPNTYTE